MFSRAVDGECKLRRPVALKTKKILAVGKATLDWKSIFTAAKVGGVKNYFVEMDLEKMRASVPYLRKLQV